MELKRWIYNNSDIRGSKSLLDSLLQVKNIASKDRASFISPVFNGKKSAENYQQSIIAANLVKSWMEQNKKIVIFGDYDVDGTCATAILRKTFQYLDYHNISFHIPSRFNEGYGINPKSIEALLKKKPQAIISVDCGINANEGVDVLKSEGIEVLITDHHTIPSVLPNADFILDPKLDSADKPYYDLCGAGVAFYLALNLLDEATNYEDLLQLAALATIADLVPLTRDNRLIVASGLKLMMESPFLPLKELFKASNLALADISAGNLAFKIAPSINAAGRLKHAYEALKLLIESDQKVIQEQAKYLFELNNERKFKQEKVITEACNKIDNDLAILDNGIITVYSADWHEGVIGIAASRLVEVYNRPAIVFALKDGILKGSARSVGSFSIYDAINSANDLLITFGGHKVACGLSLELEKFDDFNKCLKEYCAANLSDEDLALKQKIDLELKASDINLEALSILNSLEPFGIGNPKPNFAIKDLNITNAFLIGKNKDHLKLNLAKDEHSFEAIKFSLKNPQAINPNYRVDLAFNLKDNTYNNKTKIQLMLKNIRLYDPSHKGLPAFAFAYYAKELLSRIAQVDQKIDFRIYDEVKKLTDEDIIAAINSGKKLLINNYQSLLAVLYIIYDSGISLKKLLDYQYLKGIIDIVPLKVLENHYFYGINNIYANQNSDNFKEFVSSQLKYNKNYFVKMYNHLSKTKKVDALKFIYSSLYPLATAIGLEFFKEAGFILEENNQFIFIEKTHDKYEYHNSKIKRGIDNLYAIL